MLDFLAVVIPERLERSTYCLEGSCSIQLSYGTDLKFICYENGAKLYFSVDSSKKKRIYLCFYAIFSKAAVKIGTRRLKKQKFTNIIEKYL